MSSPAIERCFGTIRHPIVTEDFGDAKAIVAEHPLPPRCLGRSMGSGVAPRSNRGLVAPEGQRQELARFGETLKPLDGEKTVNPVELRPERGGKLEVAGLLPRCRPGFEQDGDHGRTKAAWGADASRKKIRSSRRMNLSRWLKA